MLFAIDIGSRKVEIVGMFANPGGPWMEQMARNLVDAVDGFLLGKRYLLINRDPLYTEAFRRILGQGGVRAVRLPARSPNLNAFADDLGSQHGHLARIAGTAQILNDIEDAALADRMFRMSSHAARQSPTRSRASWPQGYGASH